MQGVVISDKAEYTSMLCKVCIFAFEFTRAKLDRFIAGVLIILLFVLSTKLEASNNNDVLL